MTGMTFTGSLPLHKELSEMMQELEAALNNAIPALMEFLPRGAASVEEPVTEAVGVSEVETVI